MDDPRTSQHCKETVTKMEVTQALVEGLLQGLSTQKVTTSDDISPYHELTAPLTTAFSVCLRENTWSSVWKKTRVVPVYKTSSRPDPNNYQVIPLLSVEGKVFETIVADMI